MKIRVISYNGNANKSQIDEAVRILNAVQNYFLFELTYVKNDICDGNVFDWCSFDLTQVNEGNSECLIYITDKKFKDNWFSHQGRQYSVITTYDWEEMFAPPSLKTYVIYQIAQTVVCFKAGIDEKMELKIVHNVSVGCIFDLCQNKKDIKYGMVSGTICPLCKGKLLQYGVGENIFKSIERMLNYVRSDAIGRPIILNEKTAFIIMPFSNKDENDNAYKYGINAALAELGIHGFRADYNVTHGTILENVIRYIKESRFIIVKVDSQNMNVYFELGVAFGLEKDILPISSGNFVGELPSDLRNWQCLTYTLGDYKELKDKIVNHYRNNYHY